jgi:uncharacterized membrane protein YraQ (UPF0718 family)
MTRIGKTMVISTSISYSNIMLLSKLARSFWGRRKKLFLPFIVVLFTLTLLKISNHFLRAPLLTNRVQDFVTLSLSIFVEAFPFLALGSLLAAFVNTYVPAHTFEKLLPKTGVFRRAILSLMGFLFPVCECGNVPLSRALMIQGLKPSEAITFLLAAPVINPVTMWATWAAFSYDRSIVVSRVAATFVTANIAGYILSLKKREQDFLTDDFIALCEVPPEQKRTIRHRVDKLSSSFTHEAYAMIKMLAFGAIVAGTV